LELLVWCGRRESNPHPKLGVFASSPLREVNLEVAPAEDQVPPLGTGIRHNSRVLGRAAAASRRWHSDRSGP
jgi:hypothetical protein